MQRGGWARRAGATLAALALMGCGDRATPTALGSADDDLEPPPGALGSVRRPATTYRMIRTGERCEVVFEEGGVEIRRLPKKYACPKDLELGEWIRITGMTCLREGGAPPRTIPVVCPDYLTNAERDHRLEMGSAGVRPVDGETPPTPSASASATPN
ncbi:MAG TPA: hypothetical protein VL400_07425 [Polyangiaceae bacterium]|nr:hypothetical protein [Polyangiaceae bacterium]